MFVQTSKHHPAFHYASGLRFSLMTHVRDQPESFTLEWIVIRSKEHVCQILEGDRLPTNEALEGIPVSEDSPLLYKLTHWIV